jgi:hypothetical protein
MAAKEPTLKNVMEILERLETKVNDLTEKVRHIIHRLPDDFTSDRCSHDDSDDESDHAFDSFPDSDDD